jgi:hypothetical protein
MLVGNGGGDHIEPGPSPAEPSLDAATEAPDETGDSERAAQGSLAKILSARKARRRGTKGGRRGGSLAERLKNVSAEAPDN